jgi:hypothetical protein
MKKLLLLILLLPVIAQAQVEFLGLVTIQDTVFYDNSEVFALLQTLPEGLKTKDKAEVIFFPYAKIFTKSPRYLMQIDGIYLAQFTYNSKTSDVVIEQPETWLIEYSLKTKKFKEKKKYNNDTFDIFKPKDLEKKIKDKMKEKEKPGNTEPGDIKPKGKIK